VTPHHLHISPLPPPLNPLLTPRLQPPPPPPPTHSQVLLEAAAFENVKERLQELGAVDAQGMNVSRLSYRAKAGWLAWVALKRCGGLISVRG
jgi:hypothetical protein